MATPDPPRRPAVELFTAYPTLARVCSTRYIDGGTHLDTEIKLWRVTPKTLITTHVVGAGAVAVTIPSLTLAVGELYRVRVRYENEGGWGARSANYFERVPRPPALTELSVPDGPKSAGLLPVRPTFSVRVGRRRPIIDKPMDTGHFHRRLVYEDERAVVMFTWTALSDTRRDTLRAFLESALAAGETFSTDDSTLGSRDWMPRRGSLEEGRDGPGHWSLRLEAMQAL